MSKTKNKIEIDAEAMIYALGDVGVKAIEYEIQGLKFEKKDPRSLTSFLNQQYKKYLQEK